MGYWIVIGAFGAASAILLALAFAVFASVRTDVPLRTGLLYVALVLCTFIALVRVFVFGTGDPFTLLIAVAAAIPCAIAGARMIAEAIGARAAHLVFESKPFRPIGTDFSLANKLEACGDIDGALDQYWTYFCDEPQNHQTLFRGGAVAEANGRYEEAERFYESLREFFVADCRVWANATLRLANVQANHQRDTAAANVLLRSVASRASELDEGRTAARILERRSRLDKGERIA